MCSYAPLPSTNDRLFEDYLASSNQQESIYIGGAPQDSDLDLSMIENNNLTNIAGESSMLLPEEPKLKVLYDAVWKYGSDVWGQNAQTAEAPPDQSAYSSGQQCYFDRLPTSSEFDNSKEKFDYHSRFIDPSLLSNPSSSPVFAGEFDAAESDTSEFDTPRVSPCIVRHNLFHSRVNSFLIPDTEDKVHGAVGSYGLQKNSEFPPSSENWGYIASNNIERSKRMPVEGLSTMLDQFPHALELKNNVSCKDELPTSSGGTQRETEAPSINGRRRIECQFPDCNKKKGFKNMQTYTIHMRKHQDCSTKALPAYPSQVSDIDLANPGVPLPYVIPPPVEMEDKIFRCPYAGCRLAPFKSINTFRRHCDSVHSGKEAECPFCMLDRSGRKDRDNSKKAHLFTRADALQKHLKRVHPTIEKNDSRVLDVMRSLRRGNGKGVIWDKTTEPAGKGFEGRDENGMLVVDSIAPKRKRTSTKACKDHSQKLKKAKLHESPSKEECGPGGAKEEATISPHSSLSISSHYYPSFDSSSSFSSFIDSSSSISPSTNGSAEIVVPLRKGQRTSTAAAWNGKTGAKVSELKREVDSDEETTSAKRPKYFHASDMLCGLGEAAKKENAPEFLGLGNEVTGQNVALKSKAPDGGGSASSFGEFLP
ncbi:hypothetical protein DFP73DRAFT_594571 [Morchella snyderi]|nr:hypothetical protein DFP73DRAFT_594571 [Morchella snyderi]